ncbi:hypothetical protein CRG98_021607 [Punica granatum]|uniref:Uncharacterized protein n=1 Tax=Punica granatum TaxID=22663 RepID=A0A2I0JP01_PUNGR|nr:hypothetical protein CRG98_021607 [Punica granatum]
MSIRLSSYMNPSSSSNYPVVYKFDYCNGSEPALYKTSDSHQLGDWRKSLVVVNPRRLSKALRNESGFVAFNFPICSAFHLMHPFTFDQVFAERKLLKCPCFIGLESTDFFRHCVSPSRILNDFLIKCGLSVRVNCS